MKQRGASKEIAMILEISDRIVESHLNNIYNKLDVTNKTSAVTKSIQMKITNNYS